MTLVPKRTSFLCLILLLLLSEAPAKNPALPDRALTPGDALAGVTVEQLRQPGYSRHARHISVELRRQVLAEYGIAWEERRDYELDHLVSLSIGGSNDIKNLWPEPPG